MQNFQTDWSDKKLKVYLLLYCANADLIEHDDELDTIEKLVTDGELKEVKREFAGDNDYIRIQKILSTVERLDYPEERVKALLRDAKTLFEADGNYSLLEKNVFRELKRLLLS